MELVLGVRPICSLDGFRAPDQPRNAQNFMRDLVDAGSRLVNGVLQITRQWLRTYLAVRFRLRMRAVDWRIRSTVIQTLALSIALQSSA